VATPTITQDPAKPSRRERPKDRPFPISLYQTAVGKKWVMAITGLMLLGFVLFHMLGNMKLYLGEVMHEGELVQDIDVYGEFLRDMLTPLLPRTYFLWLLRVGLIGAFALHIHSAYSLTILNQKSDVRYQSKPDWLASTFASRTMRVSGVIVLFYLIFHLFDLTWGGSNWFDWLSWYEWERGEVYSNLVGSLSNPFVALIYIVANVLLALHIYHGAWSMFQSLGVNNPKYNAGLRYFATGFALLILVGNVSFPITILADLV